MFHGSSTFVRFGNAPLGQPIVVARLWAGVALMLLALAIIVWPQLLAYLIAGAIFFAGVTLAGWGLALRRAEQARARQRDAVYYEVS